MDITGINSTYNASSNTDSTVSKKKSGSDLNIDDFFKLLAAQLQNQNMMDPVDNTQFIAQMAQFSTLSQMSQLTNRINTSFAVSLVGKSVTVSSEDAAGIAQQQTGLVDQVSFQNGTPYVMVNGKSYGLENILSIKENTTDTSDTNKIAASEGQGGSA